MERVELLWLSTLKKYAYVCRQLDELGETPLQHGYMPIQPSLHPVASFQDIVGMFASYVQLISSTLFCVQ
jgi:hypothetical protein